MTEILVAILVIVLVGGAICALIWYAPFVPAPFKTWGTYAVGAIMMVLIIVQLLGLLPGTTNTMGG